MVSPPYTNHGKPNSHLSIKSQLVHSQTIRGSKLPKPQQSLQLYKTEKEFIMISISTSTSFSRAHFVSPKVSSNSIKSRSSLRISAACTSTAERQTTGSHTATTSSLYEVLGIQAGATCQEIKAAYRRLARIVHPDVASNGQSGRTSAGDQFMKVHEAYATLSDPEKRADYDRVLYSRRPTLSFSSLGMSTCTDTMASRFAGYTRRKWETDQCW